jgi:hypothetical protein
MSDYNADIAAIMHALNPPQVTPSQSCDSTPIRGSWKDSLEINEAKEAIELRVLKTPRLEGVAASPSLQGQALVGANALQNHGTSSPDGSGPIGAGDEIASPASPRKIGSADGASSLPSVEGTPAAVQGTRVPSSSRALAHRLEGAASNDSEDRLSDNKHGIRQFLPVLFYALVVVIDAGLLVAVWCEATPPSSKPVTKYKHMISTSISIVLVVDQSLELFKARGPAYKKELQATNIVCLGVAFTLTAVGWALYGIGTHHGDDNQLREAEIIFKSIEVFFVAVLAVRCLCAKVQDLLN